MTIIFGYGSLINIDSLRKTISSVGDIKPGNIKGFRRVFDLRAKRISSKCGPVAVLDIVSDIKSEINGVYFEVDKDGLEELKKREILYNFIAVDIFNDKGDKIKGVTVQAEGKPRTDFKFDCFPQKKYLDVCLAGAKSFGKEFYGNFLKTTFIGNKNLIQAFENKKQQL